MMGTKKKKKRARNKFHIKFMGKMSKLNFKSDLSLNQPRFKLTSIPKFPLRITFIPNSIIQPTKHMLFVIKVCYSCLTDMKSLRCKMLLVMKCPACLRYTHEEMSCIQLNIIPQAGNLGIEAILKLLWI